jgi:TonB family protein
VRFLTTILVTIFAASAAAQSAPADAESHFGKATAFHQKSDVEAEIAELREAIRLKPDFAEAHLNLGLALFKRREKDAAINEYREAIRLKPDLPEAHLALGIALGWKADPNGAVAEYREATRLKPDYEEAHRNLGYELMSLGKRQEGLDELERAHALKPELSRARVCSDKNPPPCATPPRVIKSPDPKYSKEARKKNIEGITVLWLIVGADGLPRDIRVVRSVGYGLDEEAIKAAKKWRFKPSTMDGKPVPMQINIDVAFHLH